MSPHDSAEVATSEQIAKLLTFAFVTTSSALTDSQDGRITYRQAASDERKASAMPGRSWAELMLLCSCLGIHQRFCVLLELSHLHDMGMPHKLTRTMSSLSEVVQVVTSQVGTI